VALEWRLSKKQGRRRRVLGVDRLR
jgi:hypothetical protein